MKQHPHPTTTQPNPTNSPTTHITRRHSMIMIIIIIMLMQPISPIPPPSTYSLIVVQVYVVQRLVRLQRLEVHFIPQNPCTAMQRRRPQQAYYNQFSKWVSKAESDSFVPKTIHLNIIRATQRIFFPFNPSQSQPTIQ